MLLAPSWAMFGGAIDAKNAPNPHLASGVHLRILPSATVGLPSTPLFVSRFEATGNDLANLAKRSDIRWTDATGAALTMPFSVPSDPSNPITGFLPGPPSGTCIWLNVQGHFNIGIGVASAPATAPPFRLEAWANGPRGPSLVATSVNFFPLSAPRIDYVVIRPRSDVFFTVDSVSWIAAEDIARSRFVPWRVWSMPTAAAPRYQPTASAVADSNSRVTRGAPPHQLLFINPVEGGPSASPVSTPAAETARIATLSAPISQMLTTLLNDLSAQPQDLSQSTPFSGPNGVSSNVGVPLLGHVLQANIDPGMARWLGFADVDESPPDSGVSSSSSSGGGGGQSVVFYLVRGLWPARSDLFEQLLFGSSLVRPGPALSASFPELAQLGGLPSTPSTFFDFGMILAVTLGGPPDRPDSPASDDTVDEGWRPDLVVPNALRTIDFSISDLLPAAAIAFAVKDGGTNDSRPLNPALGPAGIVNPDEPGYVNALPLPLYATVDDTNPQPGTGHFSDRDCPPEGGDYRIAQADLFGRWSEWTHIAVPSRPRTPPPAPSLDLHYQVPTLAVTDTAPESGTFTVSIPVPPVEALPAGGLKLADLALEMQVNGAPGTPTTFPLPSAPGTFGQVTLTAATTPGAPALLTITFTGPALSPAASAVVTFVGTWGDTAGTRSTPGTAKRTIFDPRPVPPPTMPTDLIFARRPDARGNARLELPFPNPSPLVRLYYSTETTLMRALALLASGTDPRAGDATTAIAEITAAKQGSARAQAFGKWKALFDYTMFENLTTTSFSPQDNGFFFPHVLSASLDGLALYRVLSVAPSGVLSDFATSPLVAAMIPNFIATARPLLSIGPQDPSAGTGVVLTVKVSGGTLAPSAFRVRRASQPYPDPRQMLVVNTGALASVGSPPSSWLQAPPTTDAQGTTTFTLVDPGPLTDWKQYFWSVEVQAAPPDGLPTTAPAVDWSLPSSPAHLNIVPANPPGAPDSVTAQRNGSDVVVTVTATGSSALIGTRLGTFRLEVFRVVPGARPSAVTGAVAIVSPTQMTVTDSNVPANASYTARVVDPLGRRGVLTTSTAV